MYWNISLIVAVFCVYGIAAAFVLRKAKKYRVPFLIVLSLLAFGFGAWRFQAVQKETQAAYIRHYPPLQSCLTTKYTVKLSKDGMRNVVFIVTPGLGDITPG